MKTRLTIFFSLLCSLCLCSCSSWREAGFLSDDEAVIFPDYKGVTVPCNIAPLNFMVEDADYVQAIFMSGDEEILRVKGKDGIVRIPMRKWQDVLAEVRGKDIQVSVSLWSDDYPDGMTYAPFSIYIAQEEADPWIAYRLIEPGYVGWRQLGIYQREISSFEESAIVTNRESNTTCLNCHNFPSYSSKSMMFHARGANGGTVLYDDGKLTKIDFKNIGPKKRFIRLPRFMSNKLVSLIMALLIVSVSAGLLIKGNDMTRGYEEVARLEYFGEHEEWDRILETVSQQEAVNNEYQRKYVLLALLNEGKLTDYAFSYGLSDSDDFLFYNIQEPFCLGFNVLFYNSLDMYNPAIYNTYQEAVQSTPGLSFDTVRYLADVYLKLGDHALASKYLDLLSHSTCHRRWVKERLPLLESLEGRDASYPQSGPLFSLESFLPDISSMSDRYPHDRRYADLLLCGVLAEKDGSTFYNIFKVVSRTQYPDGQGLPHLYQEALLLVASQNPDVLNHYKIDEEVWTRFADFTELMQKGKASQAKRKYAGTYWAYVY